MRKHIAFVIFSLLAISGLTLTSCSKDDDGDAGNLSVGNDPNKPIVTGTVDGAAISLDYRGVLCNFYGYCNMRPEVIALSEVGMEIYEKAPDSNTETMYVVRASGVNSGGKFIVSSEYAKTEKPETITNRMVMTSSPLYINAEKYSNKYRIRAYIKTGDTYQYGDFRTVSIPLPEAVVSQLSITTGDIILESREYRYKAPYLQSQLALSTDKSLLTEENIIRAEANAETVAPSYTSSMGTPSCRRLGELYILRSPQSYYLNYYVEHPEYERYSTISFFYHNILSSTTYYREYYYTTRQDGTPVIKLGEIKEHVRQTYYN